MNNKMVHSHAREQVMTGAITVIRAFFPVKSQIVHPRIITYSPHCQSKELIECQ
ncbi:MAG: hypothetical protein OEY35_05670 [Gammaproteobacteria bacterium]|nr:hypothetical protein [Gammaproteobacteria bacterium]